MYLVLWFENTYILLFFIIYKRESVSGWLGTYRSTIVYSLPLSLLDQDIELYYLDSFEMDDKSLLLLKNNSDQNFYSLSIFVISVKTIFYLLLNIR